MILFLNFHLKFLCFQRFLKNKKIFLKESVNWKFENGRMMRFLAKTSKKKRPIYFSKRFSGRNSFSLNRVLKLKPNKLRFSIKWSIITMEQSSFKKILKNRKLFSKDHWTNESKTSLSYETSKNLSKQHQQLYHQQMQNDPVNYNCTHHFTPILTNRISYSIQLNHQLHQMQQKTQTTC